jgi:serine/threonine protein kinase
LLHSDEVEWQWTAPEVISDENALNTKSDVWSFGVLMYEMITFGKIPYSGTLRALNSNKVRRTVWQKAFQLFSVLYSKLNTMMVFSNFAVKQKSVLGQ